MTSVTLDPTMKTNSQLSTLNPQLVPDGPATWQGVKYWAELAAKFSHASVAAQVMAGFALSELRKANNVKPGQPKKVLPHDAGILVSHNLPHDVGGSATSPHDAAKLSWPEMVEKFAGISDDTARRWMAMADDIKARWKKLAPQVRLKELMAVPPSDWTEKDTKLVTDSLHKVADGSTQLEFMRELGLAKQKPGANSTGGTGGNTKKKLSLAEEKALHIEMANVQWHAIQKQIGTYTDKFLVLTDHDIEAQIAVLEQALTARKTWLKQPLNKRDVKAIAQMFNTK